MLYWPFRSPLKASSRLPGKIVRSLNRFAECNWISFRCATLTICENFGGFCPLNTASADLPRKDRITASRYSLRCGLSSRNPCKKIAPPGFRRRRRSFVEYFGSLLQGPSLASEVLMVRAAQLAHLLHF